MAKMEAQRGVTPAGVVIWTDSLYEKDARFAKGDETKAKFKGYITYDKGNEKTEPFVQERIARHKAAKGKADYCPVKDGDEKTRKATEADVRAGNADEIGEEINDERLDGKWYIQFTTKTQPTIFDAFKRRIPSPEVVKVLAGDLVRFQYKENIQIDGNIRGCFLYLDGVQLLEKRNTGFLGGDLFDVVDDGYQAPEASEGGTAAAPPAKVSGDY